MAPFLSRRTGPLSPGAALIVLVALTTSALVLLQPLRPRPGLTFWLFSPAHLAMYQPQIDRWNAAQASPEARIEPVVLHVGALERRLLSGFLSGTPLPDLVEVESAMAGSFFAGPPETIGFTDLATRLRREGLIEELNPPSVASWTRQGKTFGLPHDVHPVLLAYRADLVEAAGIDVSQIETWEDFVRLLGPLQGRQPGADSPSRYLLGLWETDPAPVEILLLQAGGGFFDAAGRATLDLEVNARVAARIVLWTSGPQRIATQAPYFSAAGNQLLLDGRLVAQFMPDWLAGVWQRDLPELAGKVKLMPLPAWEPGGRRTSVFGGTMLGLPRRSRDPERAWNFGRDLYFSPQLATELFRTGSIISPVRRQWTSPVYDEPSAYFSGQAPGRMFIEAAPAVPVRVLSPFKAVAVAAFRDALLRLKRRAAAGGWTTPEEVLPAAREELAAAQREVLLRMARNHFVSHP